MWPRLHGGGADRDGGIPDRVRQAVRSGGVTRPDPGSCHAPCLRNRAARGDTFCSSSVHLRWAVGPLSPKGIRERSRLAAPAHVRRSCVRPMSCAMRHRDSPPLTDRCRVHRIRATRAPRGRPRSCPARAEPSSRVTAHRSGVRMADPPRDGDRVHLLETALIHRRAPFVSTTGRRTAVVLSEGARRRYSGLRM
jgi:hypothetical protein